LYRTARTTPLSRAFLVAESDRIGVSHAARNMGVSRRTVYRWRRRAPDFADRRCRPARSPRRSSDALEADVLVLRMERRWGPDRIGPVLGVPPSTVHRILRRHQAHRLSHLFPKPPRSFGHFDVHVPGELVAIDTKQLGRLDRGGGRVGPEHHSLAGWSKKVGWRHLFVAIDFASRLVYTELRASDVAPDSIVFLDHALAFFDAKGIRVRRVLTDNGNGYKRTFHEHCQAIALRHSRIKPRHPWTNGRVERFIGTIQREFLYAGSFFRSEDERALALWHWRAYYNGERPHIALGGLAPADWLARWNVTKVYEDLS
jgi:transposase InsO family protein